MDYPRVTDILAFTQSAENKARLENWRQRCYRQGLDPDLLSQQAKDLGTQFHTAIFNYLKTGEEPYFANLETCGHQQGLIEFTRWRFALSHLNDLKAYFLYLEQEVISQRWQYIGHLDGLALLDNRLVVIDWKTSGKYKKREWIHDYFIQGTAYALAAFESGLVNRLPEEVHIYIFSPQRCQIFTAPVATFGPLWIQRLNQYQYLTQSLTA
ncbi:MAG: hypothetical protein ACKN9E_01230 [Microcystaceae cyanobacterium]